jgi:phosphatidate phosphatase LPIN
MESTMESVRSGLRLASNMAAHAAIGVGGGSLAAVSTVLPSTGGAIDLIVVRQPDGTLRCSPFYVRFGKYQGLIRGREKVVTVTVNGVLSDFTMQLGRSGEAYFVESVAVDEDVPVLLTSIQAADGDGDGEMGDLSLLDAEILAGDALDEGEGADVGGAGEEVEEQGSLRGRIISDRALLGGLEDFASPPSERYSDEEGEGEGEARERYKDDNASAAAISLDDSAAAAAAAARRNERHGAAEEDGAAGEGVEEGADDFEGGEGEGDGGADTADADAAGHRRLPSADLTLDELRELAATHAGVAGDVTLEELREFAAILNTRRNLVGLYKLNSVYP